MGRNPVVGTAPAVNIESDIAITMRRLMGVNIPRVEVKLSEMAPYFSPGDSSFWMRLFVNLKRF
ncbi:hypothetical protein ACFL6A_04280 [bacterium]